MSILATRAEAQALSLCLHAAVLDDRLSRFEVKDLHLPWEFNTKSETDNFSEQAIQASEKNCLVIKLDHEPHQFLLPGLRGRHVFVIAIIGRLANTKQEPSTIRVAYCCYYYYYYYYCEAYSRQQYQPFGSFAVGTRQGPDCRHAKSN